MHHYYDLSRIWYPIFTDNIKRNIRHILARESKTKPISSNIFFQIKSTQPRVCFPYRGVRLILILWKQHLEMVIILGKLEYISFLFTDQHPKILARKIPFFLDLCVNSFVGIPNAGCIFWGVKPGNIRL